MIEDILVGTQETVSAGALRVEPAQERSLARIDALLDAAAAVVDEVGFDRLTTAQVAELSGASIGTVYRYFPDRIALLAALHDRAVLRYRVAASEELERRQPAVLVAAKTGEGDDGADVAPAARQAGDLRRRIEILGLDTHERNDMRRHRSP